MPYTEDELIEQPALKLFSDIGWQLLDCYSDVFGKEGIAGHENRNEFILSRELHAVLTKTNLAIDESEDSVTVKIIDWNDNDNNWTINRYVPSNR